MGYGQVNAYQLLKAVEESGVDMTFPNVYVAEGENVTLYSSMYMDGYFFTVTLKDNSIAKEAFDGDKMIVIGSYSLETDPELGAIIRGNYDYDSDDWAHRYIVKNLTATEMIWVAKDDEDFIQKYRRVDSIPVKKD